MTLGIIHIQSFKNPHFFVLSYMQLLDNVSGIQIKKSTFFVLSYMQLLVKD